MHNEHDVMQFVIVPPYGKRCMTAAEKERLEFYLGSQFRAYTFKVASFAPVGEEEVYSVLPIMNFVDDEGKMRMCAQPRSWVVREIADACQEFKGVHVRTWAA